MPVKSKARSGALYNLQRINRQFIYNDLKSRTKVNDKGAFNPRFLFYLLEMK